MNFFTPARRFDPQSPELVDRPGNDPALLREELETLEKMNRQSGAYGLILDSVQRLPVVVQNKSVSVLDLGTGFADIPRAIAGWAREKKLSVAITAVDRNPDVLHIAQKSCDGWPEIRFEQHDVRALPFAAGSFDVVLCSLALHHFSAEDAVIILRRMQEIARVGFIVNDLRRNWPAIVVAEIMARTVIRSWFIRHDAVQSARAAFTTGELQTMAEQAGLKNFHIAPRQLFLRMILEGRK